MDTSLTPAVNPQHLVVLADADGNHQLRMPIGFIRQNDSVIPVVVGPDAKLVPADAIPGWQYLGVGDQRSEPVADPMHELVRRLTAVLEQGVHELQSLRIEIERRPVRAFFTRLANKLDPQHRGRRFLNVVLGAPWSLVVRFAYPDGRAQHNRMTFTDSD